MLGYNCKLNIAGIHTLPTHMYFLLARSLVIVVNIFFTISTFLSSFPSLLIKLLQDQHFLWFPLLVLFVVFSLQRPCICTCSYVNQKHVFYISMILHQQQFFGINNDTTFWRLLLTYLLFYNLHNKIYFIHHLN